jgi:hypothetical protein
MIAGPLARRQIAASTATLRVDQPFAGGLQRFGEMEANQVFLTGSRKKLDPGTAATPTSRASHSQNAVSSSQPNSEMSTIT